MIDSRVRGVAGIGVDREAITVARSAAIAVSAENERGIFSRTLQEAVGALRDLGLCDSRTLGFNVGIGRRVDGRRVDGVLWCSSIGFGDIEASLLDGGGQNGAGEEGERGEDGGETHSCDEKKMRRLFLVRGNRLRV